jgi:predicted TPR repeat methyltransferase
VTDTPAIERALQAHRAGRLQEAADLYAQILEANPENPDALNLLGLLALEIGRVDKAIELVGEAAAFSPDTAAYHRNHGDALQEAGRFDEAIAAYARANALGSTDLGARFNLAMLHVRMRRFDEALRWFERALELAPDDPRARHYAAVLKGTAGDSPAPGFVEAEFDAIADQFDSLMARRLACDIPAQLGALFRETTPGARELEVLDLGCGTGLSGAVVRDLAARMSGCDLSARMLQHAEARGLYDALYREDVVACLERWSGELDLALAADVFIYVGKLDAVFARAAHALRPGGWLVFSVEERGEGSFGAAPSGRFDHSAEYVRELAARTGFEVRAQRASVLRTEADEPVGGLLFVLERRCRTDASP